MVMTRLIQKPWPRVLRPLLFFLSMAAFLRSSEVRATAPMSASFVPKHALFTFLNMDIHAVFVRVG